MKTLKWLFLLTGALNLTACLNYDPFQYTVTDIKLLNADNSGQTPVTNNTGTVAAKTYALQVRYTSHITARQGHIVNDESPFALQFKTTAFKITSTTNFDNDHAAGSSLNDLFILDDYKKVAIDSAFASQTLFSGPYPGRGGSDKPWDSDMYLLLMKPPASLGHRRFILQTAFANNTQFTDSVDVTLQ